MKYQIISDNKIRTRSKLSDEELARIINEENKRNPSEYSSGSMDSVDYIPDSCYFVKKTSACGIEQIRKGCNTCTSEADRRS